MIGAFQKCSVAVQIGAALVNLEEGDSLKAYPDPATGGEPYTIGRGNTRYMNGSPVAAGDVITQDQDDQLFLSMFSNRASRVDAMIKLICATPFHRAAFYSFAWNEGLSNFATSTMLHLFNQGEVGTAIFANDGKTVVGYTGAAGQFIEWDYANGKPMQGLLNRRVRERNVFFGDISGLGFPPTFLGAST